MFEFSFSVRVRLGNRTIGVNLGEPRDFCRLGWTELKRQMPICQHTWKSRARHILKNRVKPNFTPQQYRKLHNKALGFTRSLVDAAHIEKARSSMIWAFLGDPFNPTYNFPMRYFLKLTPMVRLGNREEIRRNTQKYPSNTQKYAETPYQYAEIPKQIHPKQIHPKQKPYRPGVQNWLKNRELNSPSQRSGTVGGTFWVQVAAISRKSACGMWVR